MKVLSTIFFLVLSNNSIAADGKIIFSKGEIRINNVSIKTSSPLNFGDRIKTSPQTTAILKINPGTVLKLKPNSEVVIEKPTKTANMETQSYTLKLGEMFIQATKTKNRGYKVKSNNVTFGVRGTTFFVSASKNNKNWMCVNEGVVSVKLKDKSKVLEVKAGEGVKIDSNILPKVRQYPWTKKLNWKMAGTLSEIQDNVDINSLNYDIEELDYE